MLTKKGSPDKNVSATLTKTSNSFTLKPDSNLSELSKYELSIKNIKDLNQNKLATTIIKFKTKDTTPPTVSITNTNQSIILTFSEKLKTPEQANFILKQDTDEVEFDLNTSKNPIIKLSSKTSFKFDKDYNLTITNIQDLSRNTMTKTNKIFKTKQSNVPRTGQTKCYDSSNSNNEILCTHKNAKGQDGYYESLNLGKERKFTRSNDIVTDNITNLEWQDNNAVTTTQKKIISSSNDEKAENYCNVLNLNGTGWRLPTIQELIGIIDYGKSSGASIFSDFTNTATDDLYWTNTSYAPEPEQNWQWDVFFKNGIIKMNHKSASYYVRCVRQ